jgi:phosphoribosyl 1,2-cyclic phosphodiesterase
MRVDVLGTGSADRWPNPWCTCDRCQWAREAGVHRGRTSALVDGCLLIDPGPDAGSGGVDLSGVRTVLITHDHPDHLDPAFLLAWSWASGPGLLVAGPAEAIERCRQWVGPDAPVEFRALAAGDELAVDDADGADGALRVRALPAAHSTNGGRDHDGTALLFEVMAPDASLLYATDTAALPHDDLAGPYDVVLLELTFGDTTAAPTWTCPPSATRSPGCAATAASRGAPGSSRCTCPTTTRSISRNGSRRSAPRSSATAPPCTWARPAGAWADDCWSPAERAAARATTPSRW